MSLCHIGHVERGGGDGWVSACDGVVVLGVGCVGGMEGVCGGHEQAWFAPGVGGFGGVWGGLMSGQTSNPS